MKTIEAIISLLVLLSFFPLAVLEVPPEEPRLYEYQLADDVWRIAYLRGCFVQESPAPTPTLAKDEMESCLNGVIAEIETETQLKIEFENLDAAGSVRASENAVRIQKTIIVNGIPEPVYLRVE